MGSPSIPVFVISSSGHFNFQRNSASLVSLLRRKEVEAFKSNDAATTVFNQHDVVIRFFADVLFLRVIEPDAERVPLAVEIDSYFFHSSVPGLMFFVKYAVTTN